ncbi:MAG TPA: FAD-dependent oxidoreductase [Vicinamibacterales bacterium]|nr:FAD-dependent oxidoreductase [Vicinamibacterales bacterium]
MTEPRHSPYWQELSLPRQRKLDHDDSAEVVVIGGGNTGLVTAYLLATSGKSVAVLERATCARIDTGHTSAHLTMVTDHRLQKFVRILGRNHAQAVWDAGFAAIAQIERIVVDHEIDAGFDWVDGYLHLPISPDGSSDRAELEAEAALAREFGFDAEFVDAAPFVDRPAARFGSQARLHPRRYLAGLLRVLDQKGVRIYEHSEATKFLDTPRAVEANGFRITCDDIVLATHNPLLGLSTMVAGTLAQTKLSLYTSYVVAGRVAKGAVPDALWWDTSDPYHYLRIDPHRDYDVVIFGGADHKTGQVEDTEACYRQVAERLRAYISDVDITHRWSGQVIDTPDGLPYIGETAPHQYAATGFVGNGLTFGTVAGIIIADAITKVDNPWRDLFNPTRKALGRSTWNYLSENKDYPYYLIRDRLVGADQRAVRSIKRGQGAIIERDGQKVAASRDERGRLILRSAVCTHMGCLVRWNPAERTWDCPCHGSRFTPAGKVISGPAETELGDA